MAESRMELFIETLTGTAFELSCSPQETIVSIKAKIQYSEGIPVSQQHLIWRSQELNDDLCLEDYRISDGATLKLVLGMRGGPINTRHSNPDGDIGRFLCKKCREYFKVSDTKKLRDLAEYVERSSETAGSGGRPLTVLVFHDGDKVHMYTLMEKGECTVSPLSGTISETSSVASIKNVEELDQEERENEVTREKLAQLQEQLRNLSLNKPKKVVAPAVPRSPTNFYLPPIERLDVITSPRYSYKTFQAQPKAKCGKDMPSSSHVPSGEASSSPSNRSRAADLDYVASNIFNFANTESPRTTFLPYLSAAQGATSRAPREKGAHGTAVDMVSLVKYDPSRMKKCPGTSSEVLPSRRFIELDNWLHARPKTSPDKTTKTDKTRAKRRIRHGAENPLSVATFSEESSSLLVRMLNDDVPNLPPSMANEDDKDDKKDAKTPGETAVDSEAKASTSSLKPFSVQDGGLEATVQSTNPPSKPTEETSSRVLSAKKLPVLKAKKKTYKRCSLCSKKTGLATSYTCRCGKNFCASHRYAELHHCSYDYKTEGRRLLQMNNPVVTASKLPKI